MTDLKSERGTKRTCQSCETRYYDLGRSPAVCPKCGAEFVEPVRPPPTRYVRKRAVFGRGGAVEPVESENGAPAPADELQEGEDSDEEREEELDGEPESEDSEE